jgi:hypothetical protein
MLYKYFLNKTVYSSEKNMSVCMLVLIYQFLINLVSATNKPSAHPALTLKYLNGNLE